MDHSCFRNTTKDRMIHTVNVMNDLIYDTVDQHISLTKGTDAAAFIQKSELTFLYPKKSNYLSDTYINELKNPLALNG